MSLTEVEGLSDLLEAETQLQLTVSQLNLNVFNMKYLILNLKFLIRAKLISL